MANKQTRFFTLLWVAVAAVGVLLVAMVVISVRIAIRTNNDLVRHRALTVLAGVRTVMQARGPVGLEVLDDALPLLLGPGILQIGVVGPGLKYLYSSDPDAKGKTTHFQAVITGLGGRMQVSQDAIWHGKQVRVFVFSRSRRFRMMSAHPPVLEVVVDTAWPGWLRTWITLMAGTSALALVLLVLFGRWLQKQTRRAEKLARQAAKNRELRRLGELSAMVAHQLRNPLAGVKGNLQLGLERLKKDRHDDAIRDLDAALEQIQRIEGLVRDLLAFTRDLKPKLLSVDLRQVVDDAVLEFREFGKEIRVAADKIRCTADPGLLKQALVNLIHNAIQSGCNAVEIEVNADDKGCRIVVADDGPGLDAELRDKIFQPFVSGRTKGTGLGLALVERVISAHNGRITAGRSKKLGGAEFVIFLPQGGDS